MDNPWILILYLGVLALATFWMCVYIYGLYRLGRVLACRYRTKPVLTLSCIFLFAVALAAGGYFLPVDMFVKAGVMFSVWLLHAQPLVVGFWAGMEIGRKEDVLRWQSRTEEWLQEWESPVPKWLKDELDS